MMPRILVIDDDAAIAELVAVNLEMAGYESPRPKTDLRSGTSHTIAARPNHARPDVA